ncbi:hypothetical protein B0I37DRAFT_381201 [Chaetomium sp. MPI-CAGE-AT-0009]|nr:hypothetical protein B0I37DRAFT_381201 [Chaetomium sp. MPI-CAGE-AT-0009]
MISSVRWAIRGDALPGLWLVIFVTAETSKGLYLSRKDPFRLQPMALERTGRECGGFLCTQMYLEFWRPSLPLSTTATRDLPFRARALLRS